MVETRGSADGGCMRHLIDDDVAQLSEGGVGAQPLEQHPSRTEEKPCVTALFRFEPHGVADDAARFARAPLGGDALRKRNRRDAARLGHDNAGRAAAAVGARVLEQVLRHL